MTLDSSEVMKPFRVPLLLLTTGLIAPVLGGGAMVYYDESVDYDLRRAGTWGTTLMGGEGIFLAHYTGPGRVTLQTMGHWRKAAQAQK